MITIIGDVHGKIEQYTQIISDLSNPSIQIGDMGLGFHGVFLPHLDRKHKFIRGNHDSPAECYKHPNYLGDYGFDAEKSLFWIAGAASIDVVYRVEGISWWRNEQMSYEDLGKVVDLFVKSKPRFVVSHECPAKASTVLLSSLLGKYFNAKQSLIATRTCQAMQNMLDYWQPEVWVFGHYHVDKEFYVPKYETKFRCVAELSQYNLEI